MRHCVSIQIILHHEIKKTMNNYPQTVLLQYEDIIKIYERITDFDVIVLLKKK